MAYEDTKQDEPTQRGNKKPYNNKMPGCYICNKCNKMYRYKRGLQRHLRYHCGKDPNIQCPACPRKFRVYENLKQHIGRKHINLYKISV